MNWIVTVCRNGLEMTKRAVESFLRQDVGDVRVLIIDNGSTDGTGEWIHQQSEAALVFAVQSLEQVSVARAWNYGLAMTFHKSSLTAAMVANNDTELAPWTYRLLLEDPAPFVTARGVLTKREMDSAVPRPEDRRPHPDFGCFVIKRECWERVGPFDEVFATAYCEDNDYHVRMHIAGIEAVSIGVPYAHYVGGTLRSNPEEQAAICAQAEANRGRFTAKWGFSIPSEQINDGKYWEFFKKPRPDWRPFEPSTWIW